MCSEFENEMEMALGSTSRSSKIASEGKTFSSDMTHQDIRKVTDTGNILKEHLDTKEKRLEEKCSTKHDSHVLTTEDRMKRKFKLEEGTPKHHSKRGINQIETESDVTQINMNQSSSQGIVAENLTKQTELSKKSGPCMAKKPMEKVSELKPESGEHNFSEGAFEISEMGQALESKISFNCSSDTENSSGKLQQEVHIPNKEMENENFEEKSSDLFKVVLPLIGEKLFENTDDKPFLGCYDLARERNKLRSKYEGCVVPNISYQEQRMQRKDRTKEEIEREDRIKKQETLRIALYIAKLSSTIFYQLAKPKPNEKIINESFKTFLDITVTPSALLYSPHFVYAVMFCRGDKSLSYNTRSTANECYYVCHAMFPVPIGYNFETVYLSEVKKNCPHIYDGLKDVALDYDDFDEDSEDETHNEKA